ncbi:DUF2088 domain-containing protein [Xylanibacillus composti]|uniref:LarA-like N-terminal domain-containing protein n=1 Tax=Xylanibacillus composti TaxID=1572762 RepID=A0A8J4H6I5_9BACL|nr:lactate racemase domain-containing protein [Xylanibacillus composti]MDT9724526.1 DUF2088 domain-containing protein [Xylanibacillus composti]GIQ69789.1 hypothetical protein XYCOK13_26130 [Xylanibacillus composti]
MSALPKWIKIRQRFAGRAVGDIEAEVAAQLASIQIRERIKPGMRIALTAGSRGISNIAQILKAAADVLKELGALPFLIPAMGSHGGATAEGQVQVLESLGITEAYCGVPIRSSMETVCIGATPQGIPVHTDKLAWEADGVIIVNRIKVHTDFKSRVGLESGLMKMAAIGMGKHRQATLLHHRGVHGIRDLMPEVAEVVLAQHRIICGIGIVENALDETALIEAIEPRRIREREQALLKLAAAWMPKLPTDKLDLLIVDEIGKDHSGTGMDTNIIGRMRILGEPEPETPSIQYIMACDLSEASHGNALGIGLADVTTRKLVDKIDRRAMNENVITSSFLARANIPITLDNDLEAVRAAMRGLWGIEGPEARIMRIRSTLHLGEMYVSEAVFEEIRGFPAIEPIGEWQQPAFDAEGFLVPF